MSPKRKRAPTSPIDAAHRKTDDDFIRDYIQPNSSSPFPTTWTHPLTSKVYTITLHSSANLSEDDLHGCFSLIELTSRKDYEASTWKWHPSKKLKEMRAPEMRYILVKEQHVNLKNEWQAKREVKAFTSLMPTYEEGEPVVYCYEIHLCPELQGSGLGKLLMSFHTTIAHNMPPVTKVMLTCFAANERGLAFYKKLGFSTDEISPVPRRLRGGRIYEPDYVILSKRVRGEGGKNGQGSEVGGQKKVDEHKAMEERDGDDRERGRY